MHRVLIMSDSHGWTDEVQAIKERYKDDVDYMIHCGDSELDFDEQPMEGFMKVAGNCDFDFRYPNELDFEIGNLKFFVTHGHLHQVKTSLMTISYRAEELGANIICHGHSHIAGVWRVVDHIIINPGSIRLPRARKEKTYAIASWDEEGSFYVNFYDINGYEVKDLACQTKLQ
ncbi:metallophosphoesterase [Paraliobacillus ryukyuensis]|uniref:metallophosphoesterase n=1 Tax=Paraliobacillus ryukyuensis TaxID=200904 RepID=UPI0009A81F3E|nr:metallophosphoesterase [Paraliobacillus ryukyuensis]